MKSPMKIWAEAGRREWAAVAERTLQEGHLVVFQVNKDSETHMDEQIAMHALQMAVKYGFEYTHEDPITPFEVIAIFSLNYLTEEVADSNWAFCYRDGSIIYSHIEYMGHGDYKPDPARYANWLEKATKTALEEARTNFLGDLIDLLNKHKATIEVDVDGLEWYSAHTVFNLQTPFGETQATVE